MKASPFRVGVRPGLLGIDMQDSLLYERHCFDLRLKRLDRNASLDFLRTGFRELGMRVEDKMLEDHVFSIPQPRAWGCALLTLYGVKSLVVLYEVVFLNAFVRSSSG